MKTYLKTESLTATLLLKQQLKKIFATVLTMSVSLALLANTSPVLYSVADTNGVIPSNGINHSSQVAGNIIAGNNTVNSNDQFSLPLVMTDYKAILENNKVSITWTIGIEKPLSHFVVEKSTNGVDFKETALVFAVTNPSAKQNYSFVEMINAHASGTLYYRIKLVDLNGRYQNSTVKLIHLGDVADVAQVATYPNPVVNELRITIPSKWQNQRVKYEVYNISGKLVKQYVNESANQTEVLSLQSFVPGMYVVRTSTASEAQSQSILKK